MPKSTSTIARFDAAIDALRTIVPEFESLQRDAARASDHPMAAFYSKLARASHDLVALADAEHSRGHTDFEKHPVTPAQRARAGR